MPIGRSTYYYFESGNVVLEVEDMLFKLHREILMLHSGFFNDMFSVPMEGTEGQSDENPLRISQDLCSSSVFEAFCQFMYPKKFGQAPPVAIEDLDTWDSALRASEALQFNTMLEYVLSQLNHCTIQVSSQPAKILYWALRSETKFDNLILICICLLAYRRRPLSEEEVAILGVKPTTQVTQIRERVRVLLISHDLIASKLVMDRCERPHVCPGQILRSFTQEWVKDGLFQTLDDSDIFISSIEAPSGACYACRMGVSQAKVSLSRWMRDEDITLWAREMGMLSPQTSS